MEEFNKNDYGYLELFLGPMFSGKTTQLIRIYESYTYIGKTVAVINYVGDTRYHDSLLSSHDKKMIPCTFAKTLGELWNAENSDIKNADIILINEGQFFDDLFEIVINMVDNYSKKVYICGLDGDFTRNKFGQMLDLIPYCDKVTKLHAFCAICKNGKKGIFSHRISDEVGQVVIGASNYIPLCRTCYLQKTP